MIRNYFKIAWRNLWKNKVYSFTNIFGLAIGLACVMLILFHVQEELSYDRGFSKADRIYRITNENLGSGARHWAATPPPMGPEIKSELPEIEMSARFQKPYPYQVLSYTSPTGQVQRFEEKNGFFADQAVVEMFDLQFVQGNAQDALQETDGIVLTERMANKYFGKENALGKTIIENEQNLPLKVTGIIKTFPFKTHLQFDYLISMPTIRKYRDDGILNSRGWAGFYTYVVLKESAKPVEMDSKITDFAIRFYKKKGESPSEVTSLRKLHLQPIRDIHLKSSLEKEMHANSDIRYLYIFSFVALFILLIAAINFINISTSQSFDREKEVGLRKVVGATKPQLLKQFLLESCLITVLATILALIFFIFVIPYYENFTGTAFHNKDLFTLPVLTGIFALIISIALLAGFYPAWFISKFNPIASIKNKRTSSSSAIRNGLIVFQFAVSVFMIAGTIIIYRQLNLFHNKNLGFDKDQVLAITIYPEMRSNLFPLINKIKENKNIEDVALISHIPGERFGTVSMTLPASVTGENVFDDTRIMWADENFLSTLHIPLAQGRNFNDQLPKVKKPEFILNQSAIQNFGLIDPLEKEITINGKEGKIIGIVNDFNFASLHGDIEPLVIEYSPNNAVYVLIRVVGDKIPQTLSQLGNTIKSISPNSAYNYSFLDEKLNQLYSSENKMSTVFKGFALLSVLISCLGLFGISGFVAKLRTKEIGVRKVLGASNFGITFLLSKDFLRLIFISIAIASPLAYFIMNEWHNSFAYHVEIKWWVFGLAGGFSVFVAFITLGFHGIKAAIANPIKSLRTE